MYTNTEMANPKATAMDKSKLVSRTRRGLKTGMAWTETAVPQPHHTKRVMAKNSAMAGRYVSNNVFGCSSLMVVVVSMAGEQREEEKGMGCQPNVSL